MLANPTDEVLSELPKKLQDRLRGCPRPGQGVNPWLFSTALSLTRYFDDLRIIELLQTYVSCTGRDREIRKAVSSARRISSGEARSESRSLWPAVDYAMIHEIVVNSTIRLKDLRSMSPMDLSYEEPRTEEILDVLFPGNPLLCVGRSVNACWTNLREFWRGRESGFEFIVPNPMIKKTGVTKDGKESQRCIDNTGRRQFVVIEFDISEQGPWVTCVRDWRNRGISILDANVALIVELATNGLPRLPLGMAVYSGGKSIHAWFPCPGLTDDQARPFMARAVRLGGDKATWTRCQLVRMPDGTRENGNRQRVQYFAPVVLGSQGDVK